MQFRLGTGIAKEYPFERVPVYHRVEQQPIKQKDYSVITKKVLIIFAIVAVCKIAILLRL